MLQRLGGSAGILSRKIWKFQVLGNAISAILGLTWLWIYCIYMVIDWLCIYCIFLQVLDVSCFNIKCSIEPPNAPCPHPPRSASATVQWNLHYKCPWGWGHTRGVSPRPSNPDPVWSQEPNRLPPLPCLRQQTLFNVPDSFRFAFRIK